VSVPGLGPLESEKGVMWHTREPITGRTCRERLDYHTRDGQQPSHSTIMTILATLRRKHLLARSSYAHRPA
jgi:predicted transcriptional regulator